MHQPQSPPIQSTQGQGLHSVFLPGCLGTSLAFTHTLNECPCHMPGVGWGGGGGEGRGHLAFKVGDRLTNYFLLSAGVKWNGGWGMGRLDGGGV